MKRKNSIFGWLIKLFLLWRVALVLIAALGISLLPLRKDYLGGGMEKYLKQPLFWSWANFDGVHYLHIAERGYRQFEQAFFPFYPYFVRFWAGFFKNYLFSALFVSHLSFLAALYLFFCLIRLDFKEKVAKRSLVYLLLFPASFYFGSVYTESLFLALVLGAFYAARKKKWAVAGILGAVASATRLVGVFLFPALIVEWWQAEGKNQKKRWQNLFPLFLITGGLLAYMWYLKRTVGDPFYFIHVQPLFGAQRTGGKIILLYQVFWRYLRMLVTVEKATPTYFTVILEAFTGAAFLLLTIFVGLRRWYGYFTFMVLAYLTPTLTGTLSSMPRYVLVLFPGFLLLSLWAEKYRWLRILYPLVVVIFLIVSLLFFTRGYWVA